MNAIYQEMCDLFEVGVDDTHYTKSIGDYREEMVERANTFIPWFQLSTAERKSDDNAKLTKVVENSGWFKWDELDELWKVSPRRQTTPLFGWEMVGKAKKLVIARCKTDDKVIAYLEWFAKRVNEGAFDDLIKDAVKARNSSNDNEEEAEKAKAV